MRPSRSASVAEASVSAARPSPSRRGGPPAAPSAACSSTWEGRSPVCSARPERLLVGGAGLGVVGLRDLEVVAEREQGPDRLGGVGLAGELDRPLEVLAGPLGVADAAEDAAEDAVGAAGGRGLAEALGQPQRLLGGVDREHVVAGVHVERGGLLVEANELEARRPVLEQVDPALVVLDRALAVALVPERGADLAVQVAHPLRGPPRGGGGRGSSSQTSTAWSTRPRRRATSPSFSAISARFAASRSRRAGRAPSRTGRAPPGSSRSPAASSPAASSASQRLGADRSRARPRSSPASAPSSAARP